jgi:hypothetical protein
MCLNLNPYMKSTYKLMFNIFGNLFVRKNVIMWLICKRRNMTFISIGQICLMIHNMQHNFFARHQGVVIVCKVGII